MAYETDRSRRDVKGARIKRGGVYFCASNSRIFLVDIRFNLLLLGPGKGADVSLPISLDFQML